MAKSAGRVAKKAAKKAARRATRVAVKRTGKPAPKRAAKIAARKAAGGGKRSGKGPVLQKMTLTSPMKRPARKAAASRRNMMPDPARCTVCSRDRDPANECSGWKSDGAN